MKQKPEKKSRKSLKVKYITNDDIPLYMKGDEDYETLEWIYEAHSDDDHQEHHEMPAHAEPKQEFFDDSSNKCDIDTAEHRDAISENDEQLK